jgi:hypothetical protein
MVTFDTNAGHPLPLMQVSLVNSTGSNITSAYGTTTTLNTETVTITEVQAATSSVLGGKFALTFMGDRSQYLSYDANALDIQRALEELGTIGKVAVSRTSADENNGYTWEVTFLTELGSLNLMDLDGTSLTGTVATGTVSKLVTGIDPPFNSSDPVLALPIGSTTITNMSQLSTYLNNLNQGIPYYVRASALNAIGQGAYAYGSNIFIIPEPQMPGMPIAPILSSVDGQTLSVSFYPPALDGGNPVNFYRVRMLIISTLIIFLICSVG